MTMLTLSRALVSFRGFAVLLGVAVGGVLVATLAWHPSAITTPLPATVGRQPGLVHVENARRDLRAVLGEYLEGGAGGAGGEQPDPAPSARWQYPVQPAPPCTSQKAFVVLVYTAASNADRRQALRTTWGAFHRYHGYLDHEYIFSLVFVMGHSPLADKASLQAEIATHGDILIGDFNDTYYNLTTKGLAAYEWLAGACPLDNLAFIFKTDDDVFVNMFYLVGAALKLASRPVPPFFLCNIMRGIEVERTGKYAMTRREYPDPVYPTFCQGVGYLMGTPAFRLLRRGVRLAPPSKMEDVYFTGVAPQAVLRQLATRDWDPTHNTSLLYQRVSHKMVIPNLGRVKDVYSQREAQHFVFVHQLPLDMWQPRMAQLEAFYSTARPRDT